MDLFYFGYAVYISSEGIPTMKCSGINGSSAVSANVRLPGRRFECDVAEGLSPIDVCHANYCSKYVLGSQLL